jgi:hypothetical protein
VAQKISDFIPSQTLKNNNETTNKVSISRQVALISNLMVHAATQQHIKRM